MPSHLSSHVIGCQARTRRSAVGLVATRTRAHALRACRWHGLQSDDEEQSIAAHRCAVCTAPVLARGTAAAW